MWGNRGCGPGSVSLGSLSLHPGAGLAGSEAAPLPSLTPRAGQSRGADLTLGQVREVAAVAEGPGWAGMCGSLGARGAQRAHIPMATKVSEPGTQQAEPFHPGETCTVSTNLLCGFGMVTWPL